MSKKKSPIPAQEKPKPMLKVVHKGYTAVQSPRNHHVMIGKDGHMVCHINKDKPLTEAELRDAVDAYLRIRNEALK